MHDILTELILPPKTLIHGIDPTNSEKYESEGYKNCIDKYRANQAYVYKQTSYKRSFWNSYFHSYIKTIIRNTTVTQSVSLWDYSFVYETGSMVKPISDFYFVNEERNPNDDLPKLYTCNSGIHFYHDEIKAKE